MKKIMGLFVVIACVLNANAQPGVGVGTNTIHNSAAVDLGKSSKGLLVPRLTQTGRLNINSPMDGLIVYDTTTKRLYQYQQSAWRYLLNNNYWSKSTTHNYVTSLDSIGIGTSSPDSRLDVSGNIRCRISAFADLDLNAGTALQGENMVATANIVSTGQLITVGSVTVQDNVTIDDAAPIAQLKSNGNNKVFLQASGNDMRLGTNSGNTSGKVIVRMNGVDVISIDTFATLKVLTTGSGGNLTMGSKLSRQWAPNDNMTPVVYGRLSDNGNSFWMSTDGTIEHTQVGTYLIESYSARSGPRSSVLVTAASQGPFICSGSIQPGTGKIKIEIYDPTTRSFVNADFNFMVFDPQNLF